MGIVVTRMTGKEKAHDKNTKSSSNHIAHLWNAINNLPPTERPFELPVSSRWVTVRVFVSSTFDDFHSEREVLVKQVFPELREWCEARSMCLVECDLRWGIPKDTPSGNIFATCLGELDRCHQDTFGKPLMVVLLGERAGWIPQAAEVPQEIVEEYNWVNGVSVTGTEILHGAYRNVNPNAAFCLRDPSFLSQLSLQDLPRYQDKGHHDLFIQSLKEQVCHRFPKEQILKYNCQVLGTDFTTGIEKVRLGIYDEFSSWILQFLKTRILQTFSEHITTQEKQLSWQQTELAQHQLFLQQKHQFFLGRELEIQNILDFLYMDPASAPNPNTNKNSSAALHWVISQPGMGKSSLLAASIDKILQIPNNNVFYHFVGCCASSVQLSNLVRRLCCYLLPNGPELEDILLKLKDCWRNEEIQEILEQALQSTVRLANSNSYLFIDAVNQLSHPSDVSDLLSWLSTPGFLPQHCKCIISCIPTATVHSDPPPCCLYLELLPMDAAQDLAIMYLSRYSKTLSSEQLHQLLQKSSSANPLWLSLACEELRVFGVFEMLTKKIIEFPDSLQGLLESIIQRLVQEDQSNHVKKLLCLLHCCQEGVVERDLQGAMSSLDGGEEIPTMHWASFRRTLSSLLRVGRDYRGRDTLHFFHSSVVQAVEQCLLSPDNSRGQYLLSLADYYDHKCTDDAIVVNQLPRLLQEARLNGRLVEFLRKDPRARSIQAHTRAQYIKALRCFHVCRNGFQRSAAMICGTCTFKIGAFGQLFPNKQSCVLCGTHVAIMGKEAFLCPRHNRTGRSECLVCKLPIIGVPPPSPAILCHVCGFSETCISLNI
ncbi:telomerase protein component 1-like [Rana temporaria]|uniref:telomerase protein component 1-like n=1 Tax=Rana temporaria TaxID=8407 RepID=UPI001AACE374|nr:telomerase protein component 1-like [Rana temporaria]